MGAIHPHHHNQPPSGKAAIRVDQVPMREVGELVADQSQAELVLPDGSCTSTSTATSFPPLTISERTKPMHGAYYLCSTVESRGV